MADQDVEAAGIKVNGCRQGSILGAVLVEKLVSEGHLSHRTNEDVWVVVSHDCDVTNASFTAEPTVEVICGEIIEPVRKQGDRYWGKNPRLLQIDESVGDDEPNVHLEFNVQYRAVLDRKCLIGESPSTKTLARETIQRLVAWIAKRYTRRGFADEFNERTRPAVTKLRKCFKKQGHLLSGIYLLVVDDELNADEDYQVVLWAAMRMEDYESTEKQHEAVTLLGAIEAEMNGSDGVVVLQSELRSEAEISLADIRLMKRWDFDDLTLRDDDQEAIAGSDQ